MPEFAPIDVPQTHLPQAHVPNLEEPKMPEDVGMGIVAAAYKGAEVSRQRQQLERQLMQLELNQADREIRHQLESQRLYQQMYLGERRALNAENAVSSMNHHRLWQEEQREDENTDLGRFLAEVRGTDAPEAGTPQYHDFIMDVASRHDKGIRGATGRAILKDLLQKANSNAANAEKILNTQNNMFYKDLAAEQWPAGWRPNAAVFDQENLWRDQYYSESTNTYGGPEMLKDPKYKDAKKSGFVFYQLGPHIQQAGEALPDPNKPQSDYFTLPREKFEWYAKRKFRLDAQKDNIGRQIYDPNYGVVPDSSAPSTQAAAEVANNAVAKAAEVNAAARQAAGGRNVGDPVTVRTPTGTKTLRITKIYPNGKFDAE